MRYITPKVAGPLFWAFSTAFIANTSYYILDADDTFTKVLAVLSMILGVIVIRVVFEFIDAFFAIHRALTQGDQSSEPKT